MEASAACATSVIVFTTAKAGTDCFTVMVLPEMLATIAIRSRYIWPYIAQLPRRVQSPDRRELADRGHYKRGGLQGDLQKTRLRYDVARRNLYGCSCCSIQDRFRGTFQCWAGENLSSRSHSRCRFFVTRGAQNRDELSTCLALGRESEAIVPGARDGGKQGRQGRRRDASNRIWRRLD